MPIASFDKHAVDYVLKSFKALDMAFRRTEGERATRPLEDLRQMQTISRQFPRIGIKAHGRLLFIDPAVVIAVQAEGNYVLLQWESGSHLLRESISVMEEKLKPYGFIRIHRSVVINGSFVEEIQPRLSGEYRLRIKGGKEYTVTRTYKRNLKSLAEFWVGTNTFLAE